MPSLRPLPAVFFSDIYEFTSASNTISSEELITFMGYTYGVPGVFFPAVFL